jgi:hypothetical protein
MSNKLVKNKKSNNYAYSSYKPSNAGKAAAPKKPASRNGFSLSGFIKRAPYTFLMIAAVFIFWGYSAVQAKEEHDEKKMTEKTEQAREHAVEENSKLGAIESFLGAPDEQGDKTASENTVEGKDNENSNAGSDSDGGNEGKGNADNGQKIDAAADNNSSLGEQIGEAGHLGEVLGEVTRYPYSFGDVQNNYVVYEPIETDSYYYSDPGKIALDTVANYVTVDDSYYDDACFIGDSRMVGIYDYSGWDKADFYCDNGYCIFNYKGGKSVICQNNNKKYKLDEAMAAKKYGKIYIMLGTNDCGYGTTADFKSNFSDMIEEIKEKQPGAVIFLISNLRISEKAEKADETGVYKNVNINDKNVAISELADGETVFYIDCNPPFVDERGYLIEEYTFDGFHLYAKQYAEMAELLKKHGIKN